jgi:hypothetical protein
MIMKRIKDCRINCGHKKQCELIGKNGFGEYCPDMLAMMRKKHLEFYADEEVVLQKGHLGHPKSNEHKRALSASAMKRGRPKQKIDHATAKTINTFSD